MLDDAQVKCAESGYLLFVRGVAAGRAGDGPSALELFREAIAIGSRFNDPSLVAFARHGEGRALAVEILRVNVDRGVGSGEYTIAVRVTDEFDNQSVAKTSGK